MAEYPPPPSPVPHSLLVHVMPPPPPPPNSRGLRSLSQGSHNIPRKGGMMGVVVVSLQVYMPPSQGSVPCQGPWGPTVPPTSLPPPPQLTLLLSWGV